MDDFESLVERVKAATKLEDVIEQSGGDYKLKRRHGSSMRGENHDSLVVRVDEQYYVWNSKGEKGDVFTWLEERNHWDFWTCLVWLAERGKIEMPKKFSSAGSQTQRATARLREDVFGIAAKAFAELLWKDDEALAYCRGRGWTDETIREAGLGFTGRDPAAAGKMIRDELGLYQIEFDSKEAVAVIGYRGDVKGWGRNHEVEVQDNWIDWGMIPGMVGKKRLVYAHWSGGRARYLSGRHILGDEITSEGREWKSYNLPVNLAGKRHVFENHLYGRKSEEVTVVEGQADAVTLGQWGIAAVALAGTAWEDHEEYLKNLRERHRRIFIGLDADEAGEKALMGRDEDWPLAKMLGPMTRVVRWGVLGQGENNE